MSKEKLAQILQKLREGLIHLLGDRLAAVYLYGSQARGDARPDSDIDILIVIDGEFNYFEMIDRISHLTAALSLEHDTVISCALVTRHDFQYRQTPFLINLRREGIPL